MWINKAHFTKIIEDSDQRWRLIEAQRIENAAVSAEVSQLRAQKAKDDISIDWMRHRINALEKQNAILLQKAAGVNMPVPEIVPTRPGSMTAPDFSHLPSFEDVGDAEAQRLGIAHDDSGYVEFRDDMKRATNG